MENKTKQRTGWLLAALSAPLAHFSGCGWLSAALAAAVILPLTLVPKSWEGMSRPLARIQILWLGLLTGLLLKNSAYYWPSDNELVVPLSLLALAAITPKSSAPRIGAVLAFCIGLLALPLAISAAAHTEPGWMGCETVLWPVPLTLVLLLPSLPAAGEERKMSRNISIALVTVLPALMVQGTISQAVAESVPDPFYQTARTLGYLEPVAAVGMTLGWYAMAVYLLHSASEIAAAGEIGHKTASVLPVGTALAALLLKWQPSVQICTVLSALLWVLIPFWIKIKKSKKDEKRC